MLNIPAFEMLIQRGLHSVFSMASDSRKISIFNRFRSFFLYCVFIFDSTFYFLTFYPQKKLQSLFWWREPMPAPWIIPLRATHKSQKILPIRSKKALKRAILLFLIQYFDKIEKKRPKSVKNREFSTVRSPTEDTMKTALNRHFEGRYV